MKRFILLAALATPVLSHAAVIDFSSLAFDGNAQQQYASVVVGDYVFTALQPSLFPLIVLGKSNPDNADPGGATLGLRTFGQALGVQFSRVDGGAFDFSSLQVTHLSNASTSPGNGGTLDFSFDGVTALQTSYDINPGFQTYLVSGVGMHSAQIRSDNFFQFDNLVVTNVPEPATVTYMAGGLLLLFSALGRRKASAQQAA